MGSTRRLRVVATLALVGGTSVGGWRLTAAANDSFTVSRIAGADRYETASAVATHTFRHQKCTPGRAFLVPKPERRE